MTKARVLGLGFGLLLILAAFGLVAWQSMNMPVTNTALAQGAATATPSASATTTPAAQQQPQQQQSQIGDTFWTLLAGKLNVSVDDLKSKAVEARKEMIDQAVKDGRITQAEADVIKQRIDSNGIIMPIPLGRGFGPRGNNGQNGNGQNQPQRRTFPGMGGPGPMMGPGFPGWGMEHGMGMMGNNLQELDAVAKALKLDSKALVEQLSQGKTLADIAKAQSVDEATVKQAIIDARKAQIDQMLSLGLISEVQANQLKARLTPDNIDLSRGFGSPFHGMPGQKPSSGLAPNFGGQFTLPSDGRFTLPGTVQTQ